MQAYGQHVCRVLATIDLLQSQQSIIKKISDQMIYQLKVFGSRMECWIHGDKDSTLTIIVEYVISAILT